MKHFLFGYLLLFPAVAISYTQADLRCQKPFEHFTTIGLQDSVSYDAMVTIFSSTDKNFDKLSSAIRSDIIRCKRYIRQNAQNAADQHLLLQQLRSFLHYVKTHKHCCNAIQFHNQIRDRYSLAFNNQQIVQSIHATPELYGLSHKCKHKCKTYFNQVLIDLNKIDRFEDYLHADYSILKAHNYVFKIELIKVRNSIYHNNTYKYEVSYF